MSIQDKLAIMEAVASVVSVLMMLGLGVLITLPRWRLEKQQMTTDIAADQVAMMEKTLNATSEELLDMRERLVKQGETLLKTREELRDEQNKREALEKLIAAERKERDEDRERINELEAKAEKQAETILAQAAIIQGQGDTIKGQGDTINQQAKTIDALSARVDALTKESAAWKEKFEKADAARIEAEKKAAAPAPPAKDSTELKKEEAA